MIVGYVSSLAFDDTLIDIKHFKHSCLRPSLSHREWVITPLTLLLYSLTFFILSLVLRFLQGFGNAAVSVASKFLSPSLSFIRCRLLYRDIWVPREERLSIWTDGDGRVWRSHLGPHNRLNTLHIYRLWEVLLLSSWYLLCSSTNYHLLCAQEVEHIWETLW